MVNPKYVAAHGDFDPFQRQGSAGIQGVGLMERQEGGTYRQVAMFPSEQANLAVLVAGLLSHEAAALEATEAAEFEEDERRHPSRIPAPEGSVGQIVQVPGGVVNEGSSN